MVGVTTPILLAATGELVVEKSGVLNLGVEGMMLIGAMTGFADRARPMATVWARSRRGSASSRRARRGRVSMLFGVLVLTLGSNQVATGLALTIFGIGLSSLIGAGYVGAVIPPFDSLFPEGLAGDPVWRVVFGYSPLVYFALIMVGAGRLVPQPHARRPDPARGRRERHLRAFDRLFGDRRSATSRSRSAARWRGSAAPISRW